MNTPLVIMIIAVVIIGVVLLVLMSLTRGRGGPLDQQRFRAAWLKIENSLDKNNLATYQFAILNADKLLDQAMKELGVVGESMADRLRSANKKFSNVNTIWSAHKMRNVIAHEPDAKINLMTAKRALATFKKALKELGAI